MLVEDDNSLREIYQARLMAEGYETVTAKDGEEALVLIGQEKPDLIILDIMMPKISGFDTLDILRSTPATKYTKVIIMSALSQAEDKTRAEKLGANKYLVKSQVTLEDIVKSVKEVLGSDDVSDPKDLDTAKLDPATPVSSDSPAPTSDDATSNDDNSSQVVADAEAKVAAQAEPASVEQTNVVNEEKESMNNDTPTPNTSEPTPTDSVAPTAPDSSATSSSPVEVTSDPSPLSADTPTAEEASPSSTEPVVPTEPTPPAETPAPTPATDSTPPEPDAGQVIEPTDSPETSSDPAPTGGGEVVEPASTEAPVAQDSEAPAEKSHIQELIDKEESSDSSQTPPIS